VPLPVTALRTPPEGAPRNTDRDGRQHNYALSEVNNYFASGE
jgi:hypothetical protein